MTNDNERKKQEPWENETIRAILAAIPDTELNADEKREAARILTACCMATDPANTHPIQIKDMLSGLQNGFVCWQRAIADGIIDAKIPESHRDILYGSFRMAEAFLFDIEDQERKRR